MAEKIEKILVTGGAGFIGSHVCEDLLKRGSPVICIDNFNDFYNPDFKENNLVGCLKNRNFTLYREDIRNLKSIDEIFKKEKADKIIHIAARAGVRPSIEQPLLYYDVNIKGTLNLLESARKYKIKNFVFASSSSVYGSRLKGPFSENDRVDNPISPYAATKKAGEELCFCYNSMYDLPVACLRFFTVYGPRNRPDMAVFKFTKLISQNKPLPVYGNGTSKRDYTFIDDIVKGILNTLDRNFGFEIMNLGGNNPIELNYLISLIEKETGKKAIIEQKPAQLGDVPITFADISKAKKLINYNPEMKIEGGIKRFVRWFEQKNHLAI